MGEIRKDNLHESLIEELNELANIDLSGKQDKTDESLLTESKDLVGAINELFQSANNGKELIASAIGEPLSSNDTFSAMSTGIDGLLSQFKTNMMNNGVTVESSDKFKQLIDKLADTTVEVTLDIVVRCLLDEQIYIAYPENLDFGCIPEEVTIMFENQLTIEYPNVDYTKNAYISGVSRYGVNFVYNGMVPGDYNAKIIIEGRKDVNGKGIQYAEGTYTRTEDFLPLTTNVVYNLNFTPTFVLLNIGNMVECCANYNMYNIWISNLNQTVIPSKNGDSYSYKLQLTDITNSSFNITNNSTYAIGYINNVKWYAIGVGEEDTTLRDSLADILENKGVDVTEEDDMASLITKVDSISGGLDIISATELPATGRENQICVITDNPVDKFRITPNVDYASNDGNEIVVYTGTPYTSGLHSGYFLASGLDNNITEYYFDKIIQNSERKNSYIYINSTWEQMTKAYISWLENGIFMNSELFGGHTTNLWFTINSEGVTFKPDTSFTTNVGIATINRIDFTIYNKVSLKIKTNNLAGNLYLMAIDSTTRLDEDGSETSLSNLNSYAGTKYQSTISLKANDTLYYDIDISGWSGNYYLAIVYSSSKVSGLSTNYNITIIDTLVY